MSIATFRGGVHPYEGKDLSKDLPIKTVQPKKELVFPMGQHIGAPATPIVAKGDKVLVGQKIGEASGFISANICSSVSGTVKAVEPRMLLNGSQATCVVIENDGEYAAIEGLGEDRDYTKLSADEIRDIVKEAGVVGMLYNRVRARANAELDVLLDESEIDCILHGEHRDVAPEVVELVEKEAQEFVNDLLSGLRERMLELKSGRVIFLGGGANLLRRQIEASGKVGQATFVEDINANAKGYAYLYRLQHGER